MNSYVIIGNGVAATGCIEGIRSVDTEGKITVVSEEKHPVYARPLISYYLENKTDLERINYRPADFYEANGCEVLYGVKATSIDSKAKKVALDNGTTLDYTSLCVATGSSPFVPPFKGLDTVKKKHSFMTLDDSLGLEKDLDPEARVLIVGAGLIGLKCAEGIRERVKSIVVCDLADRVLSSIMDPVCAKIMQTQLEDHGIEFMLGDTATSFAGNTATMKSGATVDFDILVLAVGVRANTSLVKEAGGEINRGIIIDSKMKTTLPDVYSAGDCAEGYDSSIKANRVLAILPNANIQGRTAGANMAGGDASFDNAIPMNSIGFFGLHSMTAGNYEGELYEEAGEKTLKRLFTKDNQLIGFILIGDTTRAGIYTSLIREKTPLDTINFEMLKKCATTAAFSEADRRTKFGGVV